MCISVRASVSPLVCDGGAVSDWQHLQEHAAWAESNLLLRLFERSLRGGADIPYSSRPKVAADYLVCARAGRPIVRVRPPSFWKTLYTTQYSCTGL